METIGVTGVMLHINIQSRLVKGGLEKNMAATTLFRLSSRI